MRQVRTRIPHKVTQGIVRRALTDQWHTFDQVAERAGIREAGNVPISSARNALRDLVNSGEAEAMWEYPYLGRRRRIYRRSQP